MESYEEDIRQIILEIEEVHCKFHEIASKINTTYPKEEDLKVLEEVKEKSTLLFQKLLKLKRRVLKE